MKGFEKNPELGRALYALGSAVALKTAKRRAAEEQRPFYKDTFYERPAERVEEAKSLDERRFPDPPEITRTTWVEEERELKRRLIDGQAPDTTKYKPVPLPFTFEQAAE